MSYREDLVYANLTDETIDVIGRAWDLYSVQDNGQISRNDFKSAVRECVEIYLRNMNKENV